MNSPLTSLQSALARLFTDAALRDRFADDPVGVGRSLGLDESQARELAALGRSRLDAYADSLRRKTAADLAKVMPLTRGALGPSYTEVFRCFADADIPNGRPGDASTAEAFAAFLCSEGLSPRWLGDLARFEAAARVAADPARRLVVRRFRYPVAKIAGRLLRGEPTGEIPRRTTLAAWFRRSPRGRLRFIAFP